MRVFLSVTSTRFGHWFQWQCKKLQAFDLSPCGCSTLAVLDDQYRSKGTLKMVLSMHECQKSGGIVRAVSSKYFRGKEEGLKDAVWSAAWEASDSASEIQHKPLGCSFCLLDSFVPERSLLPNSLHLQRGRCARPIIQSWSLCLDIPLLLTLILPPTPFFSIHPNITPSFRASDFPK